VLSLALANCKNVTRKDKAICLSCDAEEKMLKATDELDKFEEVLIGFYDQIKTNPGEVISKTEVLLEKVTTEPDSNNVRSNKLRYLYELRAETFYKSGKFQQSIEEIYKIEKNYQETLGGRFSFGQKECIHLACNYIKLGDYSKAKKYIDSAGNGYYIADFILANYFEVIRNKELALNVYNQILAQEEHDHYYYYQDAKKRVVELRKKNPDLLTELFYPSDRPDDEVCNADNERRTKIFDLISNLPEVENCKGCDVVSVYQDARHAKSGKYWIKVGHDNGTNLVSQFNFFVDTLTYKVTFLDTETGEEIDLDVLRKRK